MARFHHHKLPTYSTLLCGHTPHDDIGFQSSRVQIWYNRTDTSWVGAGETPHMHTDSDECFIVLAGTLIVEVEGEQCRIAAGEFCCFPRGVSHAIVTVIPPVETLMIRAPSVNDKVYEPQSVRDEQGNETGAGEQHVFE